jgi:hypothetical protein
MDQSLEKGKQDCLIGTASEAACWVQKCKCDWISISTPDLRKQKTKNKNWD